MVMVRNRPEDRAGAAYVLGARKDEVFLQLKALLEFGIKRYCTDGELMNASSS